jgi:dethiobiotin synthetase
LIDGFEAINRRFDFVLVEGVGGWMVPITKNYFVGDLAAAMDLPVLVLARNQLGCLNHTLLTLQSIEAKAARAAGIVLNPLANGADIATATNADVLAKIIDLPLLPILTEDSTELSVDWCCALTINPG